MSSISDTDDLLCLWCYRTLPFTSVDPADDGLVFGPLTVGCACGVTYTTELLLSVDRRVWRKVLQRDGFEVTYHDGGGLTVKQL